MRVIVPPAEPTTQDEPDSPGPDEPPSIHIQLVCHADIAGTPIDGWLDREFARAVCLSGVGLAQINLVIVADDEMVQLHEQYTGVAGTTDVLTFNMADPAEGGSPPGPAQASEPIEADIILCLDEETSPEFYKCHPVGYHVGYSACAAGRKDQEAEPSKFG